MRALLAAAAVALLLSGCGTPAAGPTFSLSGAFTQTRTQQDLDEFNDIVAPYSDDVAIMESFPEQFSIRGIEGGCEQLRTTLESKDYIATVGTCRAETGTGDAPDDATSNP